MFHRQSRHSRAPAPQTVDTVAFESLEDRLLYGDIVNAAKKAALNCRKASCPLNQYEVLRELYVAATGIDSLRQRQSSVVSAAA